MELFKMPTQECICKCKCAGCIAIKKAALLCDCALCQLLRELDDAPEEKHECFTNCSCVTCEAVRNYVLKES
ncbi:putative 7.1 kDa protein in IAP2-VLF1 intergenic region, partial [Frankliniella fusca]